MSRTKNIISIIESCEKAEFDKIVKSYLKEIHNYNRVVITDGKDDTGIDIKVFDLNNQSAQYQLTTQKSQTLQEKKQLEYKILEDLGKAKENLIKYGYSNTLFFFYSKLLTNKVIRNYRKIALKDFGVNLEIIDANQIAEESEEFLVLQKTIYDTSGLADFKLKESIFENNERNFVFDLIGFGKPADIRLQIVEAYILQLLFDTRQLHLNDIILKCMAKFNAKENRVFYDKLLSRLQSSKKIYLNKDNDNFQLTVSEISRISNLHFQAQLDEDNFTKNIFSILKSYQQETNIDIYILHLKKIYSDNFNSDISDVINNSATSDLSGISRDFINYITKELSSEYSAKKIALDLFNFCDENKFIQKICAGKVFSDQTNLNRLEDYANTQKRVFIDTSLALHALCYYYKPKCHYKNYFYHTTHSTLEFCKKNAIKLYIPEFYLWEAQNHIREAINLIPFTYLPSFQSLGKSRNVFYNFYVYLLNEGLEDNLNYESFLVKFGFKKYDSYKTHNQFILKYLTDLGINKYILEYEYEIEDTVKMIQSQLIVDHKFKTKFGLNNDGIMIEFLGHDDSEVHPLKPVFITWDRTFFKIQSKYYLKNPTAQRWLLFTPSKFIDHYSLLNFSIDSESVTKEIISLLSDEIIQSTHTLLDSLIFLLNPNDEVGLEYTRRLAQIRDEEIYRVRENQVIPPEDFEGEAVIDDVFFKLTTHYREDDKDIDLLKKVFTKKNYVDTVINIIVEAVNVYYTLNQFDEAVISKFDVLIHEIIEEEKQHIIKGITNSGSVT